jgi:hypothetical protein
MSLEKMIFFAGELLLVVPDEREERKHIVIKENR